MTPTGSDPSPLDEALARLSAGESLSEDAAAKAMRAIVEGRAAPGEIGRYLCALRDKGEVVAEILGSARIVRAAARSVRTARTPLLDTCGTGGDGAGSFNVSTAAALVAAGAGASVAKHGNRSISSRCGSADLLEACGVPMDLDPEALGRTLDEAGIAFLFAPTLNPAMAVVAPVRRALGTRTIFNLLGPLANPAGARRQLMGVYAARWVVPLAEVLRGLGAEEALVVHSGAGDGTGSGLDEISIWGPTQAAHLRAGRIESFEITPASCGLPPSPPDSIRGGDAGENRARLMALLGGERGPYRDAVVANAGAALWVAGLAPDLEHGARLAEQAIDDGRAREALDRLARVSRRHGSAA